MINGTKGAHSRHFISAISTVWFIFINLAGSVFHRPEHFLLFSIICWARFSLLTTTPLCFHTQDRFDFSALAWESVLWSQRTAQSLLSLLLMKKTAGSAYRVRHFRWLAPVAHPPDFCLWIHNYGRTVVDISTETIDL